MRYFRKRLDVKFKGSVINLVTKVDKAAEDAVVCTIRRSFPDHGFLGEESGATAVDSPFRWIIDPLDGTTNFVHGFPFFCVSIGFEAYGKVVVGIVYDPTRDAMFVAQKCRGAFLNGKRIHVSKTRRMDHSMITTGFAYNVKSATDNNILNFGKVIMAARAIRRTGAAALDLCHVAAGWFDGFWELFLNPWDTAAGVLIVQEAGGRVTNFKGRVFDLSMKGILATNGKIHRDMVRILKK